MSACTWHSSFIFCHSFKMYPIEEILLTEILIVMLSISHHLTF
nr:MAG TPA: hypothetical protein [Caudoviricetes sp.]